jgi:glutathione synthase/RimK-type ligase-like ATP-grasp enzyme
MNRPIAVVYEHPEWFKPLFAEFDRRGVSYRALDFASHRFDPGEPDPRYSLVVNRMSPSAWTRGHANAIFHARHYLGYAEELGVPVVNGRRAFELELSKALQCSLFTRLGIAYPRTRVINHPAQAMRAAEDLEFPVLVKPNIGGSGAGIQSFVHPEQLEQADLDLGVDGTALVQEQLPARGEFIVRIEVLDGEFLYAIRILLIPGSFNLCPADYCELPGIADGVSGRGLAIEAYEPPDEIVEDAKRIVAAAGMDLAGVEYLINARDGCPTFYDLNALSNFVADAPTVVGFDPFERLVDFLVDRAAAAVAAT